MQSTDFIPISEALEKITAKERRLVVCPKIAQISATTVYPSLLVFFLRASLPLVNMHCGDVGLGLLEAFLCYTFVDAEKHGGFPCLLLFA